MFSDRSYIWKVWSSGASGCVCRSYLQKFGQNELNGIISNLTSTTQHFAADGTFKHLIGNPFGRFSFEPKLSENYPELFSALTILAYFVRPFSSFLLGVSRSPLVLGLPGFLFSKIGDSFFGLFFGLGSLIFSGSGSGKLGRFSITFSQSSSSFNFSLLCFHTFGLRFFRFTVTDLALFSMRLIFMSGEQTATDRQTLWILI